MIRSALISLGPMLAMMLAGCTGAEEVSRAAPIRPATAEPRSYGAVETRLLADDLVAFHVNMRGAGSEQDVIGYADCAAAQYALIRGFGFARHLRTKTAEVAGTWQADAIYTISAAIPAGTRTIDAEVTVADCKANGIPTV
ncbi:hypothetical protein ACRARG_03385 [Pseudooceanicola sp. C21-150M6]|uniref:hypothetical protein n=1 Tax=Pseudooceanicola sp. C21-150M6 TaxID=3434355 RepID=UPI003D7FEF55